MIRVCSSFEIFELWNICNICEGGLAPLTVRSALVEADERVLSRMFEVISEHLWSILSLFWLVIFVLLEKTVLKWVIESQLDACCLVSNLVLHVYVSLTNTYTSVTTKVTARAGGWAAEQYNTWLWEDMTNVGRFAELLWLNCLLSMRKQIGIMYKRLFV